MAPSRAPRKATTTSLGRHAGGPPGRVKSHKNTKGLGRLPKTFGGYVPSTSVSRRG